MTVRVINVVIVVKTNYGGKKCVKITVVVFEIRSISFPFVVHLFSFIPVVFFFSHG
jgi:hypothetical protein